MASGDLQLTIGVPSGDREMPASAGNVQRILVPAGARVLTITSESSFYFEVDTATPQVKAHNAASETTKRQKFTAGTYPIRLPGTGRGQQVLLAPTYFYLVGTEADQPFWATATQETGA